ncbi:hypothetical protein C4D60_Mb11t02860 [Musa balbisiana]|uniref:Subtilisin-like protease n=1 Tax=Musa balbisiana TaxID=52838 RepID=A0A4S8J1A4_MUSBA|nr:hypothetical protein C4D60_Mb11t02860 [Musa balbisiana]
MTFWPLAHLELSRKGYLSAVPLAIADQASVPLRMKHHGGYGTPFDDDLLAIGAFGAVKKGIFVSCAAGNSGPGERTVANEAPWLLTVAASTVDRSQRATVKLGDGQKFNGESLDQYPTSSGSLLTLFHMYTDPYCKSLNSSQVEGKVVACLVYRTPNYTATLVKAAGGVGVILISTVIEGYTILDSRCNFPAAIVTDEDGDRITSYATSATKPTVSITYDGTVIGTSPAPVVASFSSRGPSINGPGILKPDVSGPGVNILAAWPSDVVGGDGRMGRMTFNFESGTSMATPHLSGVAALLKSLHPGWSPAAIKSAIITTSDDKDRDGNEIMNEKHTTAGFFAMGAGHVNPSKAADPGLVYDLGIDDYIAYVCGKFGNKGVRDIVRDTTVDCGKINNITESELNYPSIVVAPKNGTAATVKRTVTNVGQANSSYTVEVEVPETVSVTVRPPSLSFSEVNQKMSFLVTAKWTTAGIPTRNAEGNLKWVSGGYGTPFDDDLLAIGAFGAVKKGIFVSCAAGNSGPGERTVANEAPWLLTVAASTVDRSQRATVKLGDGQKFNGESLDQYPTSSGSLLTLFHMYTDPYCKSLNSSQVEGKVVASLDADGLNIWHKSFLPVSDDDSDRRLIHSYSQVFSGFAARLTEEEAKSVAKKEGFLRGYGTPFDDDLLAIGAFGAVKKGIFVSCAAGNSGPGERTVANEAPWLLTVAASTVDRSQRATVKLGDGQKFNGESLDQYPTSSGSLLTLFHMYTDPYCKSLNSSQVEGKVVACLVYRTPNYTATLVKAAGGVGVILISTVIEGYTILDSRCNFPAAIVTDEDGDRITSYATSATKPTVSITYDGTVIGTSPAPVVASFSSRGPSINGPGILKPDVSGPGVNILAAWPSDVVGGDGRMGRMTFNFESGTSMATPHLSGVAALLKSLHPGWSPAAIKSAIITTSDDKDRDGNEIMNEKHTTAGFFAMGAGHVNPSKAADPGLVYDLGIDDYIAYVCGKFGNKGVRDIVRDTTVDCGKINNITESELNYPSIVVAPKNGTAATVKRTVTNVGQANSSYTVEVEVPETVSVTVRPPSLSFSEVNQKMSFLVTAKWTTAGIPTRNAEGNLKWVSGKRVVRSPVVVSIL